MSQLWTLTYAGATKSFADWKLKSPRRKIISQGISFVALQTSEAFDATTQFSQGATIIITKIIRNDLTLVETSSQWFVGRVEQPERFGTAFEEGISYLLVDAMYYLSETTYQIAWKERSTSGDPNSPLIDKYLSEIFLNKSITDASMTTRQQIADALQWCLTVMARPVNGSQVPFQFNANEFAAMNIPVDKVVDAPCLNVLIKQLRFMPDAVMWVNYATTPPTIHIQRRSALTPVSINVAGKPIEEINIKARYDLQRPSVVLNFRIINNNNGTPLRETVKQIAGGTGDEFRAVVSTINLEGFSISVGTTATIQRLQIDAAHGASGTDATRLNWWKSKIPWLANARIANLSINPVVRTTAYNWELLTGTIPQDANVNSTKEIIQATAAFDIVEGGITRWTNVVVPIHQEVNATDATTNSFSSGSSGITAEPVPANLAADYFAGVSFLPWEGKITLSESELTSPVGIGNVLNLTGGRSEWTTMNAVVQQVDEDIEAGKTTITFGPPLHLGIADLVELLRFNSERFVWGSNAQRVSGGVGSSTVQLPKGTPVSNAMVGWPTVQAVKYVDPANAASIINLDPTLCAGKEYKPFTIPDLCIGGTQYTLHLIGKLVAQ